MKPSQRWLCLGSFLNDFASFLLVFVVGRSLAEQNAGLMEMGLIGGGFSVAGGLSSLICGHISDRVSQRWMITIGSFLLLASFPGYLWSTSETAQLYVWYALAPLALGMIYPPVYAWLSAGDAGRGRRSITRTMIWFCLAWNLGIIAGYFTGGWGFKTRGVEFTVWTGAAAAGVNIVVWQIAARLRRLEAGAQSIADTSSEPISPVLEQDQRFSQSFVKLAWLANVSGAFGMSVVFHLFSDLAVNLGVPRDQHGMMVGATRCVIIVVYLLMWRFHFWHWSLGAALLSQGLGAAGMICLALAQNIPALIVGLALIAQLTGFNYFASLYYSTYASADTRRGLAMGLHEATISLGFAIGSSLSGVLAERFNAPRLPYVLAASAIVVMIAIQSALHLKYVRPLRTALVKAR